MRFIVLETNLIMNEIYKYRHMLPCVWKTHNPVPQRPNPTCTSSAIHKPPAPRTALFKRGKGEHIQTNG